MHLNPLFFKRCALCFQHGLRTVGPVPPRQTKPDAVSPQDAWASCATQSSSCCTQAACWAELANVASRLLRASW